MRKRSRRGSLPPAAPKTYERRAWREGVLYVAGVDEAGRGPLAGPVVAAAVMFPPDVHIPHVTDSKRLSPDVREALAEEIKRQALAWGVGIVPPEKIDVLNILRATHLAMREAVSKLQPAPELLLIDGPHVSQLPCPHMNIIDGDRLCFSIAAASILAKTTRDRLMCEWDALYPQYGFARHKGYACPEHLRAIKRYGPCPIHRLSFAPFSRQAQQALPFDEWEE